MRITTRRVFGTSTMLFGLLAPPQPSPVSDSSMQSLVPETLDYHKPPNGVEYHDNPTVFGQILRGESPSVVLGEGADWLSFQDIQPRARLHALIIPKRYISDVFALTPDDLPLLYRMREEAERLVHEWEPVAAKQGDYRLVFHVPPFNSVDHLHLHVLAPASLMSGFYRLVKYRTRSRWSVSLDSVVRRLEQGQPPVPYRRA